MSSALLVGPSLASAQFGSGTLMGPFGELVGTSVSWLLGIMGYLVALGLVLVAVNIFAGALGRRPPVPTHVPWRQTTGGLLIVLFGAALLHLVFRYDTIAGSSYGGFIGAMTAELLCSLLSTVGAWIVCITCLALSVVLVSQFSWTRGALRLWAFVGQGLEAVVVGLTRLRDRAARAGRYVIRQLAVARSTISADSGGAAAMPPVVRIDLEEEEPKSDKPALADRMPNDLEIGEPADKGLKDEAESLSEMMAKNAEPPPPPDIETISAPSLDEPDEPADEVAEAPEQPEPSKPKKKRRRKANKEDEALTIVESKFEQKEITAEEQEEKDVKGEGLGFVLHSDTYRPPPVSLLEAHEGEQVQVDREAIYAQADLLVKTLADYKIAGRVTKVHPGPVVTMYEFVPAPGTRISKVANLANDLAMSLKAQRVRIVAPIPGKGAIGIEVPNGQRETVSFKQIVADDAFRNKKGNLTLAIGKNIFGAPVAMDLARMPHLLVAGATGAGKSVSINAMICSLLMKSTPEEVRMIMVDPKFLELSGYNDIPHLLLPVVTDPKKANIALRWAVAEMERRYQLLAEMRVRDITSYNRKVTKLQGEAEEGTEPASGESLKEAVPSKVLVVRKRADGSEEPLAGAAEETDGQQTDGQQTDGQQTPDDNPKPAKKPRRKKPHGDLRRLPYVVVIIDEFADLMMVAPKEVESSVARLAQKARAAGIHLIVATQRPSVDVITGLIKANFPSRMAFQVASNHDSKTILGTQGAENLLGSGDMLVLDRGTEMKRIHGAYISDDDIKNIIDWLREQGKPLYDMDILTPPDDEQDGEPAPEDDLRDELYDKAVQIVAEAQQVSISMVQRRLRIGYNRSARMVERMEREGIVSEPDGPRGRQVLIQQH